MKKKLGAILLVVALALSLGLVPAASVGATNGSIVGLWHLDEGSGITAYDSSGNSNDGTIYGAASWTASGKFDGALDFDGSDGYVNVGAAVDDGITDGVTTAVTLEAWIKPDLKQRGGIISNDIGASKKGYDFFLWNTGTYGRLYIDFGNGVSAGRTYWAIPSADWYSNWHHVAATWDGSDIKLYVDGNQVATVAFSGNYSDPGKNTLIGGINYATLPYCPFDGLIDEVRIWDEALTGTQIEDSYSLGDVEITKKLTRVAWDGTVIEDEDGIPGVPIVPIETEVTFTMDITVTNNSLVALNDVVVKDNLGGDLELVSTDVADDVYGAYSEWLPGTSKKKSENTQTDPETDITVEWSGKTQKAHLSWDVGDLALGASATLTLVVQTDINPGQTLKDPPVLEYTSEGPHDLNSGATLSFCVTIAEEDICLVLAGTDPIGVTASEAVLILENKDSTTWVVIPDGTLGVLSYNLSGPTFDYAFNGYGLEDGEDYSLIYYADYENRYVNWGGDNPGALIGTGTADGSGNLVMSGSPDLGMDLPSEPDANIDTHDYSGPPDNYANAHGAKIWLVPSDCYTEPEVDVWSPDDFLFETDLIWYDDTDV